jgi:hypothetical protein
MKRTTGLSVCAVFLMLSFLCYEGWAAAFTLQHGAGGYSGCGDYGPALASFSFGTSVLQGGWFSFSVPPAEDRIKHSRTGGCCCVHQGRVALGRFLSRQNPDPVRALIFNAQRPS